MNYDFFTAKTQRRRDVLLTPLRVSASVVIIAPEFCSTESSSIQIDHLHIRCCVLQYLMEKIFAGKFFNTLWRVPSSSASTQADYFNSSLVNANGSSELALEII